MKNNLLLKCVFLLAVSQWLFSCQSTRNFQSSQVKNAERTSLAATSSTDDLISTPTQSATGSGDASAEDLQADASGDEAYVQQRQEVVSARKKAIDEHMRTLSPRVRTAMQRAQELVKANQADRLAGKKITKEARKQERKALKSVLKEAKSSADDQLILEIILAILLAPVGVYLHEGEANTKFWISLALWVAGIGLFWVIPGLGLLPAIVYALLVVTDTI